MGSQGNENVSVASNEALPVLDIVNQITELLDKLDLDFKIDILKVLTKHLPFIEKISGMPGFLKVLVVPIAANTFIHEVIAQLKDSGLDSRPARQVVLNYTRKLFGLDTWTPPWLFEPFDGTNI